jgi:hypothetical protein
MLEVAAAAREPSMGEIAVRKAIKIKNLDMILLEEAIGFHFRGRPPELEGRVAPIGQSGDCRARAPV